MGKSSETSATRSSWSQVRVRPSPLDEESPTLRPPLARLFESEIFLIVAPLLVALCLPFPLAALFDSTEEVAAESADTRPSDARQGFEMVFGRSRNVIAEPGNGAPETNALSDNIDGTLEWLPVAIDVSAPRSLATELVERINHGEYEYPEDVAIGRFLEHFENMSIWLEDVDMTGARIRRRTSRWVLLVARYTPQNVGQEGTVELRFVIRDGEWRIEHVNLHRGVPFTQ